MLNSKVLTAVLVLLSSISLTAQISTPQLFERGVGYQDEAQFLHINSDSLLDVVYLRKGTAVDHPSGLYYGIGDGVSDEYSFKTEKITGKAPDFLMPIDLDNDGVKELLTSYLSSTGPCVETYKFRNEIFESYPVGDLYFEGICLNDPKRIDLNGDGFDDFYVHSEGHVGIQNISVYISAGEDSVSYIKQDLFENGRVRYLTDVNNDGSQDFFVSEFSTRYLYLVLSDTLSNSYQEPFVIDSSFYFTRKEISYVGDIDYDGDIEFVYLDRDKDSLFRFEFDNDLLTGGESMFEVEFGTSKWMDENLDGYIDYVYDVGLKIQYNNGHGEFTLATGNVPFIPSEISYEQENVLDQESIFLYEQYGGVIRKDGQWKEFIYDFTEFRLASIDDLEEIDINNDGVLDIVLASRWGHAFAVFFGKGNGDYGKVNKLTPEEGAYDISFGDLNNDQITDMLYSGIWSGDVSIKYGVGGGEFSERNSVVNDFGLVRGSAIGDFSLDSFPDIVFSSLSTGNLEIIENVNGVLQPAKTIYDGDNAERIIIEDVDEDGYPDILVYGYSGDNVYYLFKNDQNGGFLNRVPFVSAWSSALRKVDFDGDNVKEWVSNSSNSITIYKLVNGELVVWRSIGLEEFTHNDFYIVDYNGDGYKDIITGSAIGSSDKKLFLNINNEEWVFDDLFSNIMNYRLPNIGSGDFQNFDIDHDGDLDLLYTDGLDLLIVKDHRFNPTFSGATYWDVDLDSIYDPLIDISLSGVRVTATEQEQDLVSFSDRKGNYRFFLDTILYDVEGFPLNDCWIPIDSDPFEVLGNRDTSVTRDIGFINTFEGGEDIDISISSTPLRCLFPLKYYVTVKNNSCSTIDGSLDLFVDQKIDSVRLISLDDHVFENNTISTSSLVLQPGEVLKFHFTARGPGVDFIGLLNSDTLRLTYKDPLDTTNILTRTKVYHEGIRCAYDPNDKLVHPNRAGDLNEPYITNEDLFYTIRFQNTGNDTAFNIYLLDTLGEDFDLATFVPIDASHPYEIALDIDTRILRVDFRWVLLPDSTTNPIGSNGFFSYKINPRENLDDNTILSNTAGIYFDFNPPIITNTTKSVFIENLDSLLTNTNQVVDNSERDLKVFPNPSSGFIWVEWPDLTRIDMYSISGSLVFSKSVISKEKIDLTHLEAGMYLLKVMNKNGQLATTIVFIS